MALKTCALIILSTLISACSFQRADFSPVTSTPENQATVYIYRPASLSNIAISPEVLLNEETLFTLSSNRYNYVHLDAGLHEFKLDLDKRYIGIKQLKIDVIAGKTYYLKVNTLLRFEKNAPYTRRFDLLLIDPLVALNEIRQTQRETSGYQQTQTSNKDIEPSNSQQAAPQFDLSKNRNPFGK